MQNGKQLGRVKFFNQKKGFGFIHGDSGEEFFVHATGVNKDQRDANGNIDLAPGDTVEFNIGAGLKGLCAVDVVRRG